MLLGSSNWVWNEGCIKWLCSDRLIFSLRPFLNHPTGAGLALGASGRRRFLSSIVGISTHVLVSILGVVLWRPKKKNAKNTSSYLTRHYYLYTVHQEIPFTEGRSCLSSSNDRTRRVQSQTDQDGRQWKTTRGWQLHGHEKFTRIFFFFCFVLYHTN